MKETNALLLPKKKDLTNEIATVSVTGVRNAWLTNSLANGLTPTRLAAALQAANHGDDFDLLTLAEEMEEREPHYASVLGTRKLAIEGLPVTVEAAGDDAKSTEIAEAVTRLTETPEFGELCADLLDGLGKGRSTCEILWQTGQHFLPVEFEWRDPRYFKLHPENPKELRLLDEQDMVNGLALPPYKFVTHIPKLKTGIVSRSGLARLVAVSYMCKSFALSDWMAFAELFGLPIRVGRYGQGTSEDDQKILKSAVASIGSDAAAIIPDSMRIEFIERATTANGDQLFMRLAEWLDKQTSKAVLGQTATTEGTPGKLGNEDAQSDVRQDILKADAKQLARTINRDLVKPYIDLNWGLQEHYPQVVLFVEEPEDMKLLVGAVEKLVPLGLRVKLSEFNDKLGLATPEEGDEILKAPAVAQPEYLGALGDDLDVDDVDGETLEIDVNHICSSCKALNQVQAGDEIDDLLDEVLEDWEPVMVPIINPLIALVDEVGSFAELKARLPELLRDGMDPSELIDHLTAQTFKARGLGDAG